MSASVATTGAHSARGLRRSIVCGRTSPVLLPRFSRAALAGLLTWSACLLMGASECHCQPSSRKATSNRTSAASNRTSALPAATGRSVTRTSASNLPADRASTISTNQTAVHAVAAHRMPLLAGPLELAQLDLPPAADQPEGLPEPYASDLGITVHRGEDNAAQAASEWSPTPITQLTVNVSRPAGQTPRDYAAERPDADPMFTPAQFAARPWPLQPYHFAATAMRHQPLYFEEVNLERYGYSLCCTLQPTISAAHFFATVPALPYLMAANCPGECNYTLGHYRPGSCVPWRATCCTFYSCLGGLSESGAIYGLILLIP